MKKKGTREDHSLKALRAGFDQLRGFDSLFEGPTDFQIVQMRSISVEKQIRSRIDTERDSFHALVESIRQQGVIQPLSVIPRGSGYRLIAGERRFLAAEAAAQEMIPIRILKGISSEHDILKIQMIENLDREDLDPIDEANAYLDYYRSHEGRAKATVQDMVNELITFQREQGREDAAIIAAMVKIYGKSITTLRNLLSLITLKTPCQNAIRMGKISPTQGYVLAENKEHPRFDEVFERILKDGLTVEKIRALFKESPLPSPQKTSGRPVTFKSARKKFEDWRTCVAKSYGNYSQKEKTEIVKSLEHLLQELKGSNL